MNTYTHNKVMWGCLGDVLANVAKIPGVVELYLSDQNCNMF
jgi:hypothetical protein